MVKEKEGEKRKIINKEFSKRTFIVLVAVIAFFAALSFLKSDKTPNYWVDNISFDIYEYQKEDQTTNSVILYFNLFSNKHHEAIVKRQFLSNTTVDDALDLSSRIYFKCHNKKDNEFYYFDVKAVDSNHLFTFEVIENGLKTYNNQDELKRTNMIEIDNEKIKQNANNIDYCSFIGIE